MRRISEVEPFDYEKWLVSTGLPEQHSVTTITLGELIESGVFTWERVAWATSAYNLEQYQRLCAAFVDRFYYSEISMTPVKRWFKELHYTLVYSLMPKYKPLYEQLEQGYDPLQTGGMYKKGIRIDSDFPETLLSQNQDYASKGYEYEEETIGRGNFTEDYLGYVENFAAIDDMILGEIERRLFSSLYTSNVNGW